MKETDPLIQVASASGDDGSVEVFGGSEDDRFNPAKHGVHKTYSAYAAYAVCVNYVIGVGCFSLPFAFWQSGGVLALLCLLVGAVTGVICMVYTIECLARAEGTTKSNEDGGSYPRHMITYRKFDFSAAAGVLLGAKSRVLTSLTVAFYGYGVLWFFTAVFGNSVGTLVNQYAYNKNCDPPEGVPKDPWCDEWQNTTYMVSVAAYWVIILPLALLDVGEQIYVQVFLTCYRFSAFAVMIITAAIRLGTNGPLASAHSHEFWQVRPQYFAVVYTATAVALNCHYNMPDALQSVREKQHAGRVAMSALFTAAVLYGVIGILVAITFGPNTNKLATLNWQEYTGCGDGWEACATAGRSAKAVVVQFWVMLFPTMDMVSVFPLVTVTLANNLRDVLPMDWLHQRMSARAVKLLVRIIAALPPLALGMGLGNIKLIFEISGLFAFFLELIIPCALHIMGTSYCENRWGPGAASTSYAMQLWPRFAYWLPRGLLVYGFIAFVIALISLVPGVFPQ